MSETGATASTDSSPSPSPQEMLAVAKSDPVRALVWARATQRSRDAPGDRAHRRWVAGVALFEMGQNDEAIEELTQAVTAAPSEFKARIGVSLAAAEAAGGHRAQALERLARIERRGDAAVAALALSQRGLIRLHDGLVSEALELFASALPALERADELAAVARTKGNIGHALLLLGRIEESRAFHLDALRDAATTGQAMIVAGSLQNLGYTEMRLGNLAEAVELLERAHVEYRRGHAGLRRNLASLYEDMAEAHRVAGLTSEAIRSARLASWVVRSGGNVERIVDADLRRARCLLEHGDAEHATRLAWRCGRSYASAGRSGLALAAAALAHRAAWQTQDREHQSLPVVVRSVHLALVDAGLMLDAMALVNDAIDLQRRSGNSDVAELVTVARETLSAAESSALDDMTVDLESRYFACLERIEQGVDPGPELREALDTTRASLDSLMDPHRRAHASTTGERFRRVSVSAAIEANDTQALLAEEHAWRRVFSTRANRFDRLREAPAATPPGTEIVTILDDGYRVYAAGSADGPWRMCGNRGEIDELASWLRSSFARLLRPRLDERRRAALRGEVVELGVALGERLLPTNRRTTRVIVSPPGRLLDLPWSLVAPDGVDVLVAPWIESGRHHRRRSGPVRVVVGPNIGATVDVEALGDRFADVSVAADAAGSVGALSAALDEAQLLHVSAHGRFRADNPRFSALLLADGDATAFDLDELMDPPAWVTLAACDSGRVEALRGVGLFGLATTLLANGVGRVVAPVASVPDGVLAATLAAFYRAFDVESEGAMAAVRRGLSADDPLSWGTGHAVQVLGATIEVDAEPPTRR